MTWFYVILGALVGAVLAGIAGAVIGYQWGRHDGKSIERAHRADHALAQGRRDRARASRDQRDKSQAPAPPPPGNVTYPQLLNHGSRLGYPVRVQAGGWEPAGQQLQREPGPFPAPRYMPAGPPPGPPRGYRPVTPPPDDDTITGMPPVGGPAPRDLWTPAPRGEATGPGPTAAGEHPYPTSGERLSRRMTP